MSKTFIADKETLDKVYAAVSAAPYYGFIEHNAILAPGQRIEYIGINKDWSPITVTKGGGYTLNEWAAFPWLLGNKPYMVRSDGTPDYRLNEDDYTLKEDGTASDVANTEYDGGAFAWVPKIYKREYMAGDDRYVLFSMTAADGFEPIGFIDPDDKELEGAWLPMFYGSIVDEKMRSLSGLQPDYSKTTDAQNTAITAVGDRAKFLGGALMHTLIDLEIMLAKTTNLQSAYGSGNSSGYDASLTPTMGVKQNAVVGGGQFFGTSDGKSLNKIFHSIVLGSYQQWMRDPYMLLVNGRYKVSKNYKYDLTGATYTDTGIFGIYFGCDPDDVEQCTRLVHKELRRLRDNRLTASQLAAAKKQLIGQIGVASDNNENNALGMAKTYLHYNRYETSAAVFERINRLTADDLLTVANEVLAEDYLSMLVYC